MYCVCEKWKTFPKFKNPYKKLNYDKETKHIEFRHFAIQTRLAAKKKIQTLLSGNKAVPDLGKYESIEQYMQGTGLIDFQQFSSDFFR